jgi:small conductance mechanosensitive channel
MQPAAPWSAAATPSPSEEPVFDLPGTPEDLSDPSWWLGFVTGTALRIVVIVVLALLLRWLAVSAVNRFVRGLSAPAPSEDSLLGRTARTVVGEDVLADRRRATRATSLGRLAKNVASVVIVSVAALMVLAELGFNLGPLLAGAGVAGIAIGFGAQSVVADFISGVFMLLEDQYGVGDVVDLGEATGTVEDVRLRVTQVRSADGVVWYVRNGEILRVGNRTQGWARALVDVSVGYGADLDQVKRVILDTATTLLAEEPMAAKVQGEPEVLGVERLGPEGVQVRLQVRVTAGSQWEVQRVLREAIQEALGRAGVPRPLAPPSSWPAGGTP